MSYGRFFLAIQTLGWSGPSPSRPCWTNCSTKVHFRSRQYCDPTLLRGYIAMRLKNCDDITQKNCHTWCHVVNKKDEQVRHNKCWDRLFQKIWDYEVHIKKRTHVCVQHWPTSLEIFIWIKNKEWRMWWKRITLKTDSDMSSSSNCIDWERIKQTMYSNGQFVFSYFCCSRPTYDGRLAGWKHT